MSFENFPYSNFHELNLDWIVQKIKEAYSSENPPDYPVKSVNGQTGDVIIAIPSNFVQSVNGETGDVVLYRNPLTQFPATNEVRWNLFRICDGTETGIEFDENGASRIEGIRRIRIYDEDNPPDYPVTSVNGQTGDVQITAGVQSVNGKTGNVITPFVNPNTDILTLDSNSPSILWGISRNVAGGNVALYITTGGTNPQAFIRYTPDGGQAINLPLLTNADIPESAGVVSVNTKTGAVTLYGTDIKISDSKNVSISEQLNTNTQKIESIISTIGTNEADTSLWEVGSIYAITGADLAVNTKIRLKNYIPDDCTKISTNNDKISFRIYAWNSNNEYIGVYKESGQFIPSTGYYADLPNIDLSNFRRLYPGYKYKIIARYPDDSNITVDASENIFFDSSKLYSIEEEQTAIRNDISALQSADATHNQQISALQSADETHNQQISALQTADNTHDQQISALQAADSAHAQQIAELQTKIGTGIKEVKFTDVVSLPIRYPETGTDADITENMACVNAVLSRPGVQRTNLTIVFYNGYLTISGTIRGLTDIYLYLTKT